ncbi:GlxA family transcriptional regulator [Noviherbaspirillum denitrificans]|uniref:ArgR family transcriptional regulator n=1 Tax=Noviherbaspirillum denitrificans TaxID=1968433 RepID=A0A254TA89_9BURK|nr:helix-turn-helix domain-containing protein [Noviherbaspirillum denitrificans]OWW19077.1 ArgR family transcriptional regulator [Noviherbaspirillum denitrificans]
MPFSSLASLGQEAPLRILLVDAGKGMSIAAAGVVQPWRSVARLLGPQRLQVEVLSMQDILDGCAPQGQYRHLSLVVSDEEFAPLASAHLRALTEYCQPSKVWGAVGSAVLWLVQAGAMDGLRTALPWSLYGETDEAADRAILTPNLFEFDGGRLSCCGGMASVDFTLTLIEALYGSDVQAQVKEILCIDRVRAQSDRQRVALQARFGALQPKLSEAVALMEANIEEPLATDDIANLVGISRRQLERQFKQYLGSVPSRYYLELRLQRARQLLLDTNHSIVQVGLMCGFSSGSHFSTAYGALFGITPRDERQRKLRPAAGSSSAI